jgi:hypothetical protein
VYWIRSFVPMEKKSTSRASTSARMAADGTSIIVPTGRSGLKGIPSSSRSSLTSLSRVRHWRSYSTVLIMGNMMRTSPSAAARKMARI